MPRACRNHETSGTNTALCRACGRPSFARAERLKLGTFPNLGTPKSGGVEGVAGRRCFKRATVENFYNAAQVAGARAATARGVEWGFFPKVVGFFPIRIFVHSCASVCIFVHFIVFLEH